MSKSTNTKCPHCLDSNLGQPTCSRCGGWKDESTNTKDITEQVMEALGMRKADWLEEYETAKQLLAKDRQQLIQRIKEEVIGDEEEIYPDLHAQIRNRLRQTQREILETKEKEL